VINYHGGPESQHRPFFSAANQYLLSRGFGIMMPNVRGSTGYGRAFQMLDDYTKRWDSVRDGVDAAEWLVKSGYASPGRIATYGGSYGGFMSVACIVEDQERVERGDRKERLFGACVDIVGIVNMRTFLEKTSGYRRKLREVEYGPLADTTFLATVSSIHKADKIQVPVFIAHGFNDPRVPVEEAMQLAVALKDRGLRPRVFVAPDEGHGFAKLDNRIYFNERAAAFLEETIGGPAPAAP
jgi:dipeptidyl aminopeptidase/acylaminoacyl peptidase